MTNGEFIKTLTPEQILELRRKYNEDFRQLICDLTPDEECDKQPSCFDCKMSWFNREYTTNILPLPSNFQVIKSMSVTTLAEFLDNFRRNAIPCLPLKHETCKNFSNCIECVAHWLTQESEFGEEE